MGFIRNAIITLTFGGLLLPSLRLTEIGNFVSNDDVVFLRTSNSTDVVPSASNFKCSLSDNACLESYARKISRVWTIKPIEQWCSSTELRSRGDSLMTGLMLIKVPKAASSTLAAITLRIHNLHQCKVRWEHGRARDIIALDDDFRAVDTSQRKLRFLLAPVRAPESRALSAVYFHQISFHRNQNSRSPSDNYVLHHLRQTPSNYMTDYLQLNKTDASWTGNATSTGYVVQYVRDIVNAYDFLMVSNRMDESLVVFSLLANLPITSIMTMSSKQAGSWYFNGNRCISLVSSTVTDPISSYFESSEWKLSHSADRLLYSASNVSLNRTIAFLGDKFHDRLLEFHRLQAIVQEACRNETYFPCSQDGTPQLDLAARHCYVRDFGCGYPCIDRVVLGNVD
jgi:hypothetical protein